MEIENIIQNLLQKFKSLSIVHQRIISFTMVGVIFFLVFLSLIDSGKHSVETGYKVLFENLESKDLAVIIAKLKEEEIPYILTENNGIKLEKDLVYEKRIEFSAMDLDKGGKQLGYGLFDKNEFGSTNFEQKVKLLRSLEGELVNTLESLTPIEQAIVHIAIPNESVFVSKKRPVTASVAITLQNNMILTPKQITGVKNLVSSSVPDLAPRNVKITDGTGQPLGDDDGASFLDEIAKIQSLYRNKEEHKLEAKIIDLLSPFLGGIDAVVAKASIDFDFTQTNVKSEEYSPESVIRSKQTLEENKEGFTEGNKGGVPGAISNIGPVQGLAEDDKKNTHNKNEATINYEISKKVSEVRGVFAVIRRISVAVAIDGKYKVAEVDGVLQHVYEDRSPENLKKIEELVKKAMGFNTERKDELSINNFRFDNPALAEIKTFGTRILDVIARYAQLINYVIAGGILYIFYRVVLTPFVDRMLALPSDDLSAEKSIIKLGEIEEEEEAIDQSEDLRKKVAGQLGADSQQSEEQIRYELILEKLRENFSESPEDVSAFITNMIEG